MSTRRGRGSRGGRGAHNTSRNTEPVNEQSVEQHTGESTTHTITTAIVHSSGDDIEELDDSMPLRQTRASRGGKSPPANNNNQVETHNLDDNFPPQKTRGARGRKPGSGAGRKASVSGSAAKRPTVSSLSVVVTGLQQSSTTHANMISNLDKRVTESNSAMDNKLDRVLASLAAIEARSSVGSNIAPPVSNVTEVDTIQDTPAGAHPAPPPRAAQVASQGAAAAVAPVPAPRRANHALPAPNDIVTQENRDGYIDALMAREEYTGATTQGKTSCNNDVVFMKPYMFIEREGIQTFRQKLELRAGLSMVEYISCNLALLQDTDAYADSDLHDMIKHLGAVAIDAMVRPWPNVRRWSQHIWDLVEKGKCRWSDYQLIQDERIRLSYMNLPHQGGPSSHASSHARSSSSPQVNVNSAICRDLNNIAGCKFNSSHEDGNVKHLHVCAHCDSMGKKSSHPYHRCRSRMDGAQHHQGAGDGQYEDRNWYNRGRHNHRNQYGHGHGRGPYSGPNQSNDTTAKNG